MVYHILSVALAIVTAKASHLQESHGLDQPQIHPRLISQAVHLQEVPTKIIKITKTVAIKVPVPYPVKVPHHIPVPIPVNRPVAVPVPQIVKVPEHVPVEVKKAYPLTIPQQVPVLVSKPIRIPQPIHVPHPVAINRPVYYAVSHPIPYSVSSQVSHGFSNNNQNSENSYLSRLLNHGQEDYAGDTADAGSTANERGLQTSSSDVLFKSDSGKGSDFESKNDSEGVEFPFNRVLVGQLQDPRQDFRRETNSESVLSESEDCSSTGVNHGSGE